MNRSYDAIVVGAGPAAWSASIFLVRAGMSVLVVGVDNESGLADASDVRNFPGFPDGISGRTLLDNMIAQERSAGNAIREPRKISHVRGISQTAFIVHSHHKHRHTGSHQKN